MKDTTYLHDQMDELQKTVDEQEETLRSLNDEITELRSQVSDLEDEVEELEDNPCDCEDAEGDEYKICGETVFIKCDNIAHLTFFQLLEEKTQKFSINELTAFLEKL